MSKTRFFEVVSVVLAIALVATFFTSMGGSEKTSDLQMNEQSEGTPVQSSAESAGDQQPTIAELTTSSDQGGAVLNSAISLQNAFRAVSQAVLPSVVEVNVVKTIEQQAVSPFPFFGQGQAVPRQQQGLGSGVIVARDGDTVYVLTNHHVVVDADEINIALYDDREFDVEVVGSDEGQDLALVSFKTDEDIPLATLGNSDALMVGDWVLAVGNPLGFESTVTAGIVSAMGREADLQTGIAGYNEYIQTDAAINRGNSGGALVNIFGEVVGINSWIASPSGGNVGLGFSIPINSAKAAIGDFIEYGGINYGWLGVSIGDPGDDMRDDLALGDYSGSFIYNVYVNGPAAEAGVVPGDLIYAIDGESVDDSDHLARTVARLEDGTEVTLSVLRQGEPITLNLTIGARPRDGEVGSAWPGFSAVSLTDDIRQRLGASAAGGDVVIAGVLPDSPAELVGLRSGDIVLAVDNVEIDSLLGLYAALGDADGRATEFQIVRRGQTITVDVPRR